MTSANGDSLAVWKPEDWRIEAWWCPRDERIVMCPGPCPDGTPHLLLPPCEACDGTGIVNPEPDGPRNFTVETCPTCNGHGASPNGSSVQGDSK